MSIEEHEVVIGVVVSPTSAEELSSAPRPRPKLTSLSGGRKSRRAVWAIRDAFGPTLADRALSLHDVAEFLGGVSVRSVQRMVKRREIPAAKLGNRYYVMRSSLVDHLRALALASVPRVLAPADVPMPRPHRVGRLQVCACRRPCTPSRQWCDRAASRRLPA